MASPPEPSDVRSRLTDSSLCMPRSWAKIHSIKLVGVQIAPNRASI